MQSKEVSIPRNKWGAALYMLTILRMSRHTDKLTEFLKNAKGAVPALSTSNDHTVDIFASIRESDEDQEDAAEDVLDDLDDMDLDTSSSTRATRRQRQKALKYMEQLQRIANRKQKGIVVDLQDIAEVSTEHLQMFRFSVLTFTSSLSFFSSGTIKCVVRETSWHHQLPAMQHTTLSSSPSASTLC